MAMSLWPHFFSPALYIVPCFLRNYVTDVNIALFPAKVGSDATRFSATSALKLWTSFYQTFSSQNRRQLNCRGRNIVCDRSPLYCIIWSVGCQFERWSDVAGAHYAARRARSVNQARKCVCGRWSVQSSATVAQPRRGRCPPNPAGQCGSWDLHRTPEEFYRDGRLYEVWRGINRDARKYQNSIPSVYMCI